MTVSSRPAHLSEKPTGRVTIELVFLASQQTQVTVTQWCDKPLMVETVETMLAAVRHAPHVVVSQFDPEILRQRHRGGPRAPSDDEKLRIVKGWLVAQGYTNQEVYAREQGISTATLRRWMRQLEQEAKL